MLLLLTVTHWTGADLTFCFMILFHTSPFCTLAQAHPTHVLNVSSYKRATLLLTSRKEMI